MNCALHDFYYYIQLNFFFWMHSKNSFIHICVAQLWCTYKIKIVHIGAANIHITYAVISIAKSMPNWLNLFWSFRVRLAVITFNCVFSSHSILHLQKHNLCYGHVKQKYSRHTTHFKSIEKLCNIEDGRNALVQWEIVPLKRARCTNFNALPSKSKKQSGS